MKSFPQCTVSNVCKEVLQKAGTEYARHETRGENVENQEFMGLTCTVIDSDHVINPHTLNPHLKIFCAFASVLKTVDRFK